MKTSSLKTIAITTFSVVLMPLAGIAAPSANAQPADPERMFETMQARQQELFEELSLTDEQAEALMAIREENRGVQRESFEEMRSAREELRELMVGTASEAEVRGQFEQLQSLRQEFANSQFENMLAIREILTPDQRTELLERIESNRQRRPFHRGR